MSKSLLVMVKLPITTTTTTRTMPSSKRPTLLLPLMPAVRLVAHMVTITRMCTPVMVKLLITTITITRTTPSSK
jgi:hypothetical protein